MVTAPSGDVCRNNVKDLTKEFASKSVFGHLNYSQGASMSCARNTVTVLAKEIYVLTVEMNE